MKYAPRKVYIKENGSYTELSYKEFCKRREKDGTYADKLFIPVQGCLIETEQTHYVEFYRDKERWRYLKKLDIDNSLLSLEAFESDDDNSIDFIADEAVNVAESVVHRMMLDKLHSALATLSEDEQKLVNALFFQEMSEREWSGISGIPQKTINDRKRRILAKLKKISGKIKISSAQASHFFLWKSEGLFNGVSQCSLTTEYPFVKHFLFVNQMDKACAAVRHDLPTSRKR